MKKIAVVLFFIVAVIALNAQTEYKPVAGDLSLEMNFTPLGDAPLQIDYLRGRLFLSDKLALRLGVNVHMKNKKTEPENSTGGLDEDIKKYTQLGIFPGIEVHLGNFERLSPYVGAEVGFSLKSSKEIYTSNSSSSVSESTWNGAWQDGSERAFSAFYLNGLIGADYYLSKKLFIGMEMGLGLQSVTNKEVTKEQTGQENDVVSVKGSEFDLGVNFNPAFRLGFCF